MRKIVILSLVLFCGKFVFSGQDREGSMRPSLWRSSQTCVTASFVQLSTRAVFLHAISVDSPTVNINGDSFMVLFNSSNSPLSTNAPSFSSAAFVNTNVVSAGGTPRGWQIFYDVPYSSGVNMSKQGGACSTVLWDFLTPTYDPFYPWRP